MDGGTLQLAKSFGIELRQVSFELTLHPGQARTVERPQRPNPSPFFGHFGRGSVLLSGVYEGSLGYMNRSHVGRTNGQWVLGAADSCMKRGFGRAKFGFH